MTGCNCGLGAGIDGLGGGNARAVLCVGYAWVGPVERLLTPIRPPVKSRKYADTD